MKKTIMALITMVFIMGCVENQTAVTEFPYIVEVYDVEKMYRGTTIFTDNTNPQEPKIVEVNVEGGVVWKYTLPSEYRKFTNPGFDIEILQNGNILMTLPGKGLVELTKEYEILWEHDDPKISHDADRLPNGNTLYVFGNEDKLGDDQIKEIDEEGNLIWSWSAGAHYNKRPYNEISRQGWTHTNAVLRMENGNTLISPRNFNHLVEVDQEGEVVREIGEGIMLRQHDPEILANGNILFANHAKPQQAIELDPNTNEIIWEFTMENEKTWPIRDANRLPNGNTLIVGTTAIVEVTPDGEIVWKLNLESGLFGPDEASQRGFYKAQRLMAQ